MVLNPKLDGRHLPNRLLIQNQAGKVAHIRGRTPFMLSQELLDILACPKCKGDLDYDKNNEKLVCQSCRLLYDIKDDIPVMLIDEAEPF